MVQVEDYSRAPRRDILCIDIKSFFRLGRVCQTSAEST